MFDRREDVSIHDPPIQMLKVRLKYCAVCIFKLSIQSKYLFYALLKGNNMGCIGITKIELDTLLWQTFYMSSSRALGLVKVQK